MWWGPQIEASPSPVIFHRNPTGASANPSSSPEPSSPPSVHPFCRSTHPKRLNLYHGIASNVSSESLPPDAAAIRSLVNANRGKESHKDFKTPNLKKKRNGAINLCQLEISPVRNGINDLTRIPKELQPFSGATVAMLSHNWPSLTTIREMRSWPSRQNLIQHWTRIFFYNQVASIPLPAETKYSRKKMFRLVTVSFSSSSSSSSSSSFETEKNGNVPTGRSYRFLTDKKWLNLSRAYRVHYL